MVVCAIMVVTASMEMRSPSMTFRFCYDGTVMGMDQTKTLIGQQRKDEQ